MREFQDLGSVVVQEMHSMDSAGAFIPEPVALPEDATVLFNASSFDVLAEWHECLRPVEKHWAKLTEPLAPGRQLQEMINSWTDEATPFTMQLENVDLLGISMADVQVTLQSLGRIRSVDRPKAVRSVPVQQMVRSQLSYVGCRTGQLGSMKDEVLNDLVGTLKVLHVRAADPRQPGDPERATHPEPQQQSERREATATDLRGARNGFHLGAADTCADEHLAKAFQDAICEGPAIFAPREPPTPKDPQDPQEPPTVPGLPDSGPLLPCRGYYWRPVGGQVPRRRFEEVTTVEFLRDYDFWKSLSSGGEVLYLSRQNDSLREEFAPLLGDIPSVVPLAAEAFNNDPEAINLWIGEDRSEEVPAASYVRNDSGQLEVVLDNPEDFVPWIPFDVADVYGDGDGRYADYGRFGAALAVEVSVEAGELLYLPAMWYHRVAQRGVTIAVNYWHDMQFGHNYLHHQFLRDAFGMDRYDDVSVPRRGVGLPAAATFSAVERKALRHRFYPFAPSVSPHELEQMLLLHAFQDLMLKAAPERSWCFADRRWRELIPKSLFGQCLEEALKSEPFVDTAYLPRHDCLLLVLHHRSVPGQVLWHAWHGDVLAKAQDAGAKRASSENAWSQPSLVTLPTYNDWSKVHGGSEASANVSILENLDAREIGYNAIVEKLACPEGSVILVTSMELGLQSSFGSREPRQTRRLARVMKGGLTFGMAVDETWKRWQESPRAGILGGIEESGEMKGTPPSEEGAEEPGAPAPEPVEPFPDSRLGSVWVSLPSGSRVTLRLHHEGVEGLWELSQAEHPLPKMGAMMTYAANDGQLVQVFSDGSVRFTAAEQATNSLPTQGLTSYFPGCPEDYEVSRTIRSGTLIKQLVSGRVEIFHADGTTAFRNPTEEELQQRQGDGVVPSSGSQRKLCEEAKKEDLLKRMHQDGNLSESADLDLKMICCELAVYQDTFVDPEASKHVGLPGHWVTLHTDGSVVGRGEDGEEYEMEAVATALQVRKPCWEHGLPNASTR
eukprot:g379.t2